MDTISWENETARAWFVLPGRGEIAPNGHISEYPTIYGNGIMFIRMLVVKGGLVLGLTKIWSEKHIVGTRRVP